MVGSVAITFSTIASSRCIDRHRATLMVAGRSKIGTITSTEPTLRLLERAIWAEVLLALREAHLCRARSSLWTEDQQVQVASA